MVSCISKNIIGQGCLLFVSLLLTATGAAQVITLPKDCKFKMGDDIAWAVPGFNDAGWENKKLATGWSAINVQKDVYAWHRIHVFIPSSLKVAAEKGKALNLKLGKIDDVDQTFLNGKLIGQTGSFPPNYLTKYNVPRVYPVSVNDILWDQENIIAVRLFSPDPGGVGMYEGPYTLGPSQWTDLITISPAIIAKTDNSFTTILTFLNEGGQPFDGSIKYLVQTKAGKELLSEIKPVHIAAGKGTTETIEFSAYQSVEEDFFAVRYEVSDYEGLTTIKNERFYLANKKKKIEVAAEPRPVVSNKIKDVFTSIPFQDQQQQGYLGKRMNQNLTARLLKLDEEGTLDGYLQRPGHQDWAGEHIGKYLETACNVWENTGDTSLKMQMDRLVYQLINAQLPDGYLGTYTPDFYWTSWDVWSHKYNLYGLLAYYTTTGYLPALEASKKIGDLLCTTFGNKPGQRDIILSGTHMGMAATSVLDPMVELYRYTGEKRYLDFCYYILEAWEQNNGPKIFSSLLSAGQVNKVANGKAYEMLSNLVGLSNFYRLTGDERMLKPVMIAWNDIVTKRLYITGTTSTHEHFKEDNFLPARNEDNMGEGCVTTTWIQLNHSLLNISGDMKYADQIERSVYNHLLAAENPQTGCVSYYTPLMDKKPYTCNITCCQSSVPRGIAMIPYFTFGNINNIPMVMLYEPAKYIETITTTDQQKLNVALNIESTFPQDGNAIITVAIPKAASFSIGLRVPAWSNSFVATVGKDIYQFRKAGQNCIIYRNWKPGDKIRISFKMPVQVLGGGKSYSGQLAFQRGPQVLAIDDTLNTQLLKQYKLIPEEKLVVEKTVLQNNTGLLPGHWIGKQAYTLQITDSNNKKQQLVLVPFADASQTGGAIRVWMPFSMPKK